LGATARFLAALAAFFLLPDADLADFFADFLTDFLTDFLADFPEAFFFLVTML
jgi:hypothetical protein